MLVIYPFLTTGLKPVIYIGKINVTANLFLNITMECLNQQNQFLLSEDSDQQTKN